MSVLFLPKFYWNQTPDGTNLFQQPSFPRRAKTSSFKLERGELEGEGSWLTSTVFWLAFPSFFFFYVVHSSAKWENSEGVWDIFLSLSIHL